MISSTSTGSWKTAFLWALLILDLTPSRTRHRQVFGFSFLSPSTRIIRSGCSTGLFSQRSRRSPRGSRSPYDDEDDDYYDSYYDDDRFDATTTTTTDSRLRDDDDDGYWDEEDEDYNRRNDDDINKKNRGGMYKVHFEPDIDPKELQLDWETCSDGETEALVLLPPRSVERPTAVLHFVGGTFFGSLPKLWYRTLLEGLVRNTQCAVVVTPIPVTLLKSPLQHISLGRKLQAAFDNAWTTVLEDEYGDALSDVPLCGVGHSLGSRLLVVLATLTQNRPRRHYDSDIPAYKSFVLVSFTNYGAAAGIPGVSAILKQSKKQEQATKLERERSRRKRARQVQQDWWIDDDDDDEEEEEEWKELVDDLQRLVQEQAARVKTALTPDSRDLEFYPSPDMLWKALEQDTRYKVPETLVVQFDDDNIDQSAKLAQILHSTNSSKVHFARLRGEHLTPVSVDEGNGSNNDMGWLGGLSSQTSRAVWKAIKGRGKTRAQEEAMRELRQSLCRYISDVVTK